MRALHRRQQCLIEQLEPRELLSTYYVTPSGSDHAAGTSPGSAWRSIDRVNHQKLKPGDLVLFHGNSTFSGSLYVPSTEGGTITRPVVFSTYGSGRATVRSGNKPGIDIAQTAGVAVTNFNFVGSGMHTNQTAGVFVHIDRPNTNKTYLHIRNVDVSGYGREGVKIDAAGHNSSLRIVKVDYSNIHDNLYGGIVVAGSKTDGNKVFAIEHNRVYNIPGSHSAHKVTGSGIFIADVDGAVVQRNVVFNNGKDGTAPVGIWASASNRVVFQFNESYNNRTASLSDGGGYDFDWDVKNSVMQYNYSHGNDGPGYLLGAGYHYNIGNTLRYNISENDGRENGRGGIHLWGNVVNANIYNNVVFMSSTNNTTSAAFYSHNGDSHGKTPQNVVVENNIFQTTGGVKLVNLQGDAGTKGKFIFNGNAYYSTGSAFKIQIGGSSFSSLSAWRNAKRQERYFGYATGYQGNPRLVNPGHGGTIGDADLLANLTAYRLRHNSRLINRGLPQPTFLAEAVRADFYQERSRRGNKIDIGADEVA